MIINRLFVCVFLLFCAIPRTSASDGEVQTIKVEKLSHGVEFVLKSAHIEEEQTIHVYVPDDYEEMAEHVRYPVIYVLDGWALTHSISGIVHHLGNTASMPKAIVVAVNSLEELSYGPALYQSKSGWGDDPSVRLKGFAGGKADQYLKFVEQDLISYIDSQYRTNDFRIIVGMSPTATFALHTFWKAPELFDAHVVFAATDVIGMGYTPNTTFIDKISDSLAKNPDRKGYLYIASAQREADAKPIRNQNIKALKKAIEPYTKRNFRLRAEHIEGYGHYPMAVPGFLRAIDLIFPLETFDMSGRFNEIIKAEGNAFNKILNIYKEQSKQVGFDVRPNLDLRRNASSLRVAGNNLRNRKRYDQAIALYRYWLKDSPKSIKANAGLGVTFHQSGEHAQGIAYLKIAIKLATEQSSSDVEFYKNLLQSMQSE